MRWAKDSRNHIEKEGDLDLHSQLWVTLIFSHLEGDDIALICDRPQVLEANTKRLIRFAQKSLPTGVSDASVLKMERRWVANTLATHELLGALVYIYARVHEVSSQLATYLGSTLDDVIPEPNDFDQWQTDSRHVRFMKLSDRKPASLVGKKIAADPHYVPPPWLVSLVASDKQNYDKKSLAERVGFFSKMARGTFEQFGNHVSMLYLFDAGGEVVDNIGTAPADQAEKFMFWRSVAERIVYLRATSLIWIAEVWMRGKAHRVDLPIRKMPIIGERLQVIGLDQSGDLESTEWNIVREDGKPRLVDITGDVRGGVSKDRLPYFLMPALQAFERVRRVGDRS